MQNETALGGWSRAIRAGRFAVVRGIELSADGRLRRAVIERLMCGLEADPVAKAADFGLDETFAPELAALEPMAANGLVTVTGNRIHITAEGRPLMRTVAAVFDRYLETGAARHSRAV